MSNEIFTRILWALALIVAGYALYRLIAWLVLLRARNKRLNLPSLCLGTPSIVYFTTPECTACNTVQRPELQRLRQKLGEKLQVIEINAYEEPDLAREWGVLSVPTTFIIDAEGQPRHVNYGVTRADKLLLQLNKAGSFSH